jgi:hypothetical protein
VIYEILRGLVLGIDLMRWKLEGADWVAVRSSKEPYVKALFGIFFKCWSDCIGYNGGITYSRNNRTWEGYGTGRYIKGKK